jgi:hypothetical protein
MTAEGATGVFAGVLAGGALSLLTQFVLQAQRIQGVITLDVTSSLSIDASVLPAFDSLLSLARQGRGIRLVACPEVASWLASRGYGLILQSAD